MPDEVGTGVLRIEVDDAGARAQVDKFVADTDARLQAAGIKSGKSFSDGFNGNIGSVDKSLQKVGTDLDTVKTKAEKAGGKDKSQGLGLLLTTALAIGPALVPLGAVAIASVGALGVAAGTAALAVKGITAEIKAGTAEGKEYKTGLNELNSGLQGLEKTAASHILSSFQDDVGILNDGLPSLNKTVGQFSDILGEAASFGLDALVSGLRIASPLLLQLAKEGDGAIQSFDGWVNNGGFKGFIDYAVAELPQVAQTLGALGSATVNLLKGLAPLGSVSLTGLELLAKIVAALPPEEITAIAEAVGAWAIATKALNAAQSLGGGTGGISSNLTSISNKSAGILGVALALDQVLSSATHSTSAVQGLTAAIGEFGQGNTSAGLSSLFSIGKVNLTPGGETPDKNLQVSEPLGSAYTSSSQLSQLALNTDQATKSTSELAAAQLDVNSAYQTSLTSSAGISAYNDQLSSTNKNLQSAADNASALTDDSGEQIVNLGTLQVSQAAWNKALQESNGNQQSALILIEQATTQGPAYAKAIADIAAQQELLNNDISDAATASGLTTDQVQQYAGVLGVTGKELATNAINSEQFSTQITGLATELKNADPSLQALISAETTFSKSSDTAADKAALLGQVLVSSQGDALSYAGAIADGYAALDSFQTGFTGAEKAAVNLKTGMIDLTKAGAGPLINSLDQLQTSGEAAAQATYQHEVATKGDKQALQDAQDVFESFTRGTLIDNQGQLTATAKKLGLTQAAAKNLADQYFQFDGKTVTTDVQSIGLNDINQTLSAIGTQLSILTKTPWNIGIDVSAKGLGGASLHDVVNDLNRKDGGVTDYYAAGGIRENHIATIAPAGSRRVWAEPETGGESYIPLAPQKRARSTAIWRETGHRLGQSFADGGFSGDSGGGYGIGDLIAAINAMNSRPIILEANGTQLARAVNSQQLVLNRGGRG